MDKSVFYTSDEYIIKLVKFLSDYKSLFIKSNTEYLRKGTLKYSLISEMSLMKLTNEELNKIPVFEYKVINDHQGIKHLII